ncbi:MAG: fumarylacetoacetate hydrolase family protein [Bacteroidota bacterium]
MGYQILRFRSNETVQWGVLKGTAVTPFAPNATSLSDVLSNHLPKAAAIAKEGNPGNLPLEGLEILSPVTRPTRILCLGVNYADHRAEAKGDQHQQETLFFRKDESAITSPYADIPHPSKEPLFDYEVEMGMIIKRDILHPTEVDKNNIGDYVAGVVLANDLSARTTMVFAPFGQWYKGKSLRHLCPLGPYIHLFEEGEVEQLHDLEIKLWVNDELRQAAHTSQLITSPEEALTEASAFVDLEVGDVLLTGTPGGVALKAPSKLVQNLGRLLLSPQKMGEILVKKQLQSGLFLKPGDVVKCSLQSPSGKVNCGEQVNRIIV